MKRMLVPLMFTLSGCGASSEVKGDENGSDNGSPEGSGGDTSAGGSSGGTSSDSSGGTSSNSSGGTSSGGAGTGGSTSTQSNPLDYARGVSLGDISVDQGIRIPLRLDGQNVEPEARNAPLVTARPMLVRAEWMLDDDFEPRPIRAVLSLHYPDGSNELVENFAHTSALPADYEDPGSAYSFYLSAEQVVQGMELSIELFETDETLLSEPVPSVAPRFPLDADSSFTLGMNSPPTHLEVVLVPVHHDLGTNCKPAPDLNSSITRGGVEMPEYEFYRQRLLAMNPVSEATVTVHEPVDFVGSSENSTDMYAMLQQLREDDGAEDWVFYYGLIQPCDAGPPFSGVAPGVTHDENGVPQRTDARYRRGWGTYSPNGASALVMVHEVGHLQGRNHVGCNGSPIDVNYPNTNGSIEAYGWDIFTEDEIHSPESSTDYMGYCGGWWASQYGWNLMEPWIAELSRWRSEDL